MSDTSPWQEYPKRELVVEVPLTPTVVHAVVLLPPSVPAVAVHSWQGVVAVLFRIDPLLQPLGVSPSTSEYKQLGRLVKAVPRQEWAVDVAEWRVILGPVISGFVPLLLWS